MQALYFFLLFISCAVAQNSPFHLEMISSGCFCVFGAGLKNECVMQMPKDVAPEWIKNVMSSCPPNTVCTLRNDPTEEAKRVEQVRKERLHREQQEQKQEEHKKDCIAKFRSLFVEEYEPATFWKYDNFESAKYNAQVRYEDAYPKCAKHKFD